MSCQPMSCLPACLPALPSGTQVLAGMYLPSFLLPYLSLTCASYAPLSPACSEASVRDVPMVGGEPQQVVQLELKSNPEILEGMFAE